MADEFRGYIDGVYDGRLYGWCMQQDMPDVVAVELLLGGERRAVTLAESYRTDLEAAQPGAGRHGFEFVIRDLNWDMLPLTTPSFLSVRAVGVETPLPVSCFLPGCMPEPPKHHAPYLARHLSAEQKMLCQITAIRFWLKQAMQGSFSDANAPPRDIWQASHGEDSLAIALHHANFAPNEGEFALDFQLNGEVIFTLTFSVVPGHLFGCAEPLAIFIGGLQGRHSGRDKIRSAARLNNEIHPATSLLIALRALCTVWLIPVIIGVSSQQHISFETPEQRQSYTSVYDEFWQLAGADERSIPGKHYVIPVATPCGLIVSASHRRRTTRRRALKDELLQAMLAELNAWPVVLAR